MAIENVGSSDGVRRGLERAQEGLEASRSKRNAAAETSGDEVQRTRTSANAESSHLVATDASRSQGDRVELSIAARALSAPADPETAESHAQHVAHLRDATASGTLASMERIARAAQRLLGG